MQPEAQFAMPELPDHVFVEHILRKIDDPLDLARIRAVSRPMRDAVGVRGHRLKNYGEMTDDDHEYRPAAYLGYLSTLKHVYRQGHLFNRQYKPTFNAASQGGHLEVLKWLRSIGSRMNEVACSFAAMGGHLNVMQWLHSNGCPWNENTCTQAAYSGHLEVLQWARANGCPWNANTCSFAAMGGHLNVLQWLHSNGCPWNAQTCAFAAKGGHLEVLQWARRNGCPWDAGTCANARKNGHPELLKWAIANGCPQTRDPQTRGVGKERCKHRYERFESFGKKLLAKSFCQKDRRTEQKPFTGR